MKLEIGKIVQNKYKQFTKIIDIKGSFVYFCGWHLKKSEAEKRDTSEGHQPINATSFAALLEGEVKMPEDASKGNDDDTNTGGDDDDQGGSDDEGNDVQASDAVKALAAENDIDLATVTGTGANGNIVKKDVEAAIKAKADAEAGE